MSSLQILVYPFCSLRVIFLLPFVFFFFCNFPSGLSHLKGRKCEQTSRCVHERVYWYVFLNTHIFVGTFACMNVLYVLAHLFAVIPVHANVDMCMCSLCECSRESECVQKHVQSFMLSVFFYHQSFFIFEEFFSFKKKESFFGKKPPNFYRT